MTTEKISAKQLISNFLQSNEPGIKVNYSRTTMIKAAEDMFTANGQRSPVMAIERNGETYLINRDLV